MAHPSRRYIKYLLAAEWPIPRVDKSDPKKVYEANKQKRDDILNSIDSALQAVSLPPMTDAQVLDVLRHFRAPDNFMFNRRDHKDSVDFMAAEGLTGMWDPGDDEKAILDIGLNAQMSQTIQFLIMGRVGPDDIADKINLKHKPSKLVTPRMVQLYHHYFWDFEAASDQEWHKMFWQSNLATAYLAILHGGREQALWRAGFDPKINDKKSMDNVYRALYLRFEGTRYMPDTRETADIMTKYSKELASIYNVLHSDGAGLEEVMRLFKGFMMETSNQEMPAISDLAQDGTYSGDGKKKEG